MACANAPAASGPLWIAIAGGYVYTGMQWHTCEPCHAVACAPCNVQVPTALPLTWPCRCCPLLPPPGAQDLWQRHRHRLLRRRGRGPHRVRPPNRPPLPRVQVPARRGRAEGGGCCRRSNADCRMTGALHRVALGCAASTQRCAVVAACYRQLRDTARPPLASRTAWTPGASTPRPTSCLTPWRSTTASTSSEGTRRAPARAAGRRFAGFLLNAAAARSGSWVGGWRRTCGRTKRRPGRGRRGRRSRRAAGGARPRRAPSAEATNQPSTHLRA